MDSTRKLHITLTHVTTWNYGPGSLPQISFIARFATEPATVGLYKCDLVLRIYRDMPDFP